MRLAAAPIYPYARVLLQAATSLDRKFRVTSFVRTHAQQARLYRAWLARGKTGLPAAAPGHSMHELGLAVDIARPGVDPFHDELLAQLGAWWRNNGLGWSESDPVHFQMEGISQHAAGLASGELHQLRAPIPSSAGDMPTSHPAVTRGLNDATAPSLSSRGVAIIDHVTRAMDDGSRAQAMDAITGIAKGAGAAALASLAAGGGISGGLAAASSALAASAPVAAPLAAAGIIASIVLPTILDGSLFNNQIDPYFDATTPEAIARSRRQAVLIKQDLAETGYKFARRAGVL